MSEYTLSIIKPDAVKRNLIGKINSILESNNFKIVAQKMMLHSKDFRVNSWIIVSVNSTDRAKKMFRCISIILIY